MKEVRSTVCDTGRKLTTRLKSEAPRRTILGDVWSTSLSLSGRWRRWRRRKPIAPTSFFLAVALTTITGKVERVPDDDRASIGRRPPAPFLSVLNYFIDVSTVCRVGRTTDRLKLARRGVEGNAGRGRDGQTGKGRFDEGRTPTSRRRSAEFPTAIVGDIRYEDGLRSEGWRYSTGRRTHPAAGGAGDKSGVTLAKCYFTFDVQWCNILANYMYVSLKTRESWKSLTSKA